VVNVVPVSAHVGVVVLDLPALGLEPDARFVAHDVLSQEAYAWDAHPWVRLDPYSRVAHVVVVERV
jgi:starch synthase (maltosyl-transferring)